jgi:excinuclease ABC subunit C
LQIADCQNADADGDAENDSVQAQNPKSELPDLILIDGGSGQLSRAKQALDGLGLGQVPVIGLAKRLEEIHLPGNPEPLALPKSSTALRLLQQIRDEAHRFAVTRQRLLRGKRSVKSRLDEIPGVGPARRTALLKRFGSAKRLAEATLEEIAAVKGMNLKLANVILRELTGEGE